MEVNKYGKSYFPVVNTNSLYGIGMDYISYLYGNKITDAEKEHILQSFSFLLEKGWCLDDLYIAMNNLIDKDMDTFKDIDKLRATLSQYKLSKINLLKLNSYRAHHELRLYSSNPIIDMDSFNFSTFNEVKYEYYNEPIASFSLEDFMKYINKSKFMMLNSNEKLLGGFRYILNELSKTYNSDVAINIMLFAYDEAVSRHKDTKLKDAFAISDYLEIGYKKYIKVVNKIDSGELQFKYKKRLLFDRVGMVD